MNNDLRENIKVGLLGIIAVTLIANTFLSYTESEDLNSPTPVSNVASSALDNPDNLLDPHDHTKETEVEDDNTPKTTLAFEHMEYDFGNVKQDTENKHIFKFTNTGSNPLIIKSATGSCGCTVPTFPKEPIAPGATGNIEVVYSPGKQVAQQNKTVSIVANTEPSTIVLNIKANVIEVPQ
ncbi:MAG: DUF1573 domain-containing protein [Flavobacteriales bacterium]|nr:DUF1573 domain-containing protein [Flavobacteriales bacterium]